MKTFLLLIVLFLNFSIFTQEYEVLKKIELGQHIHANFEKFFDYEKDKTEYRLTLNYLNEKTYKSVIVDGSEIHIPYSYNGGGSFTINEKKDVTLIIEDLKSILEKIEKNKDFEINREKYKLKLYKKTDREKGKSMLYIENDVTDDYIFTKMPKISVIKWLEFIESIDLTVLK